mmetsp:Transcript_39869/g.99813  ORF Transcript_39869/g.99813 Transcript_39869/m.99813 type:complete len:84 (+) Transcript_39869:241-492(+)
MAEGSAWMQQIAVDRAGKRKAADGGEGVGVEPGGCWKRQREAMVECLRHRVSTAPLSLSLGEGLLAMRMRRELRMLLSANVSL